MRDIPERVLAKITGWSSEEFAAWLGDGLAQYYANDFDRYAFSPMHAYVNQEPDVSADLARIFWAMPPGRPQRAFREGVALALAELRITIETREIADTLLLVAEAVGAWQALDVLAEKIRRARDPNFVLSDEYLGMATKTMLNIALYSGEGERNDRFVSSLHHICNLDNFPEAESGTMLITLMRLAPALAVRHVELLARHLASIYQPDDDDAEEASRAIARSRLAKKLVDLGDIAVARVFEAIANLRSMQWLALEISRQPETRTLLSGLSENVHVTQANDDAIRPIVVSGLDDEDEQRARHATTKMERLFPGATTKGAISQ